MACRLTGNKPFLEAMTQWYQQKGRGGGGGGGGGGGIQY